MSPLKHNHSLHIDLPAQRRSEHLLRETLLKDAEAITLPTSTTSSNHRRRTSVASRSSSRTRALEASGGLWGWFWRDNGENSSSSASEDEPYLPTPLSPPLLSTTAGFFDDEREGRGRGRTAHTRNRSKAVESLERLHSRTNSISRGGTKSKFAVALETVPSVGDLRVLVAAHDAAVSIASTSSSSDNTPITPPTPFTSSSTTTTSSSAMSSPITSSSPHAALGLDESEREDVLITPPPTPPPAFSSKRPLDPNTPTISRIPVSVTSQNGPHQRQHRRALSVSVHPQVRTAAGNAGVVSTSTPSTPKRSASFRTPGVAAAAKLNSTFTPKRANSLRSFTPTTTPATAITRMPTTPTPTRVHKHQKVLAVQIKHRPGSPVPGAVMMDENGVPSGTGVGAAFAVGTPPRKMSLVDRSPETPQRKIATPTSAHIASFTPGTPQSTKFRYPNPTVVASSPSPRRNMSATSLPVGANGQSPYSSPRRTRTATTIAEMGSGLGMDVIPRTPKTFLYSSEIRHPHASDSPPTASPTTSPQQTSPNTPCSPNNKFNLRTASAQCKAQEGYVSFASVEGLGEPEAEMVDLLVESAAVGSEKKKRWFGF